MKERYMIFPVRYVVDFQKTITYESIDISKIKKVRSEDKTIELTDNEGNIIICEYRNHYILVHLIFEKVIRLMNYWSNHATN
jgi:hypothetical protein